jgi:hypothetical protein
MNIKCMFVCSAFALIAASMPSIGHGTDITCGSNRSIVRIKGPESLTNDLHAAASRQRDLLFARGTFEEESFDFLGSIKIGQSEWHVVYLKTIWASAGHTCRGTPRLLVFGRDREYLGQYSHFDATPVRIDKDAVVFELANGTTTSLKFTEGGPPPTAFIQGDGPHDFYH